MDRSSLVALSLGLLALLSCLEPVVHGNSMQASWQCFSKLLQGVVSDVALVHQRRTQATAEKSTLLGSTYPRC